MTFEMTDQEASMEAQHIIQDLKREIASAKEHKHSIIMTTAFIQKIVNAMERACI